LLLLTAAWVVPVVAPPIRDGIVGVREGRIAWVGAPSDPSRPDGQPRSLGPGVLLPGLVNAHCHLELTTLAELAHQGLRFVPWIERLVAERARLDPAAAREAARAGIEELRSTGTVAVGDVSNNLAHLDLLRESGLDAVVFFELLGWDPAQAGSVLQRAEARLAEVASSGRVRVELAAHATYSVSAALFAALVARGGPGAVHLAESAEESRFLGRGGGELAAFLERRVGPVPFVPPERSPVAYLESLGVLHRGLVAAHCVQLVAEDCALLAKHGVHVALCPRSNRNLGVGVAPVPALEAAGVSLCLGTDSAASGGRLDLMEDVAALQREFPGLAPAAIVRMATLGGAEALGLPDLGSLERGKRAALAFAPATGPVAEPLAFLTSGAAHAHPVVAA
jgi:cytosine/adenosine deaminase-related metal-dependent hydrolase